MALAELSQKNKGGEVILGELFRGSAHCGLVPESATENYQGCNDIPMVSIASGRCVGVQASSAG